MQILREMTINNWFVDFLEAYLKSNKAIFHAYQLYFTAGNPQSIKYLHIDWSFQRKHLQ